MPSGSVAVKLDASRLVDASAEMWRARAAEGGACAAPLPRPNLVERCVGWWNGVGWRTGEAAVRLRARPAVEVATTTGIESATCTYTLTTPGGTVRVRATFASGDWTWPLRMVETTWPLRPNARLGPDGRLALGG
jgi:hypothetical protein